MLWYILILALLIYTCAALYLYHRDLLQKRYVDVTYMIYLYVITDDINYKVILSQILGDIYNHTKFIYNKYVAKMLRNKFNTLVCNDRSLLIHLNMFIASNSRILLENLIAYDRTVMKLIYDISQGVTSYNSLFNMLEIVNKFN